MWTRQLGGPHHETMWVRHAHAPPSMRVVALQAQAQAQGTRHKAQAQALQAQAQAQAHRHRHKHRHSPSEGDGSPPSSPAASFARRRSSRSRFFFFFLWRSFLRRRSSFRRWRSASDWASFMPLVASSHSPLPTSSGICRGAPPGSRSGRATGHVSAQGDAKAPTSSGTLPCITVKEGFGPLVSSPAEASAPAARVGVLDLGRGGLWLADPEVCNEHHTATHTATATTTATQPQPHKQTHKQTHRNQSTSHTSHAGDGGAHATKPGTATRQLTHCHIPSTNGPSSAGGECRRCPSLHRWR